MDERRQTVTLTEEQLDHIVQKVADEVFNRIYAEIGKSLVKKLSWMFGISILGLFIYMASKGFIKV